MSAIPSPRGSSAPGSAKSIDTGLIQHWIDGRLTSGQRDGSHTAASPPRTLDVFNPATGAVTQQVVMASAEDVSAAVASATAAFPSWADTPPVRRARILTRYLNLLNEHRDAI